MSSYHNKGVELKDFFFAAVSGDETYMLTLLRFDEVKYI